MNNLFKITDDNNFMQLLEDNRNKLLIVLFGFSKCKKHNRSSKSILKQLSQIPEHAAHLFLYIDVAEYEEETMLFLQELTYVPTFMFFYNEEKIAECHFDNIDKVREKIKESVLKIEKLLWLLKIQL